MEAACLFFLLLSFFLSLMKASLETQSVNAAEVLCLMSTTLQREGGPFVAKLSSPLGSLYSDFKGLLASGMSVYTFVFVPLFRFWQLIWLSHLQWGQFFQTEFTFRWNKWIKGFYVVKKGSSWVYYTQQVCVCESLNACLSVPASRAPAWPWQHSQKHSLSAPMVTLGLIQLFETNDRK